MDARGLRIALRRAALGLAVSAFAAAAAAEPVEFLYAEANEGGSSGGHVALRLGADVYHYQQREGWLRLRREDLRDFLFEYALAGNRPVHALRLDVSPDTAARLQRRFETRLRAGESQWRALAALRADRAFLESPALAVPAAGYFLAAAPALPPPRPDPTLAALRARVAAQRGPAWIDAEIAALAAARVARVPQVAPALPALDVETALPLRGGDAARNADLAAAQTALEVLRDAPPLREGSIFALRGAPLSDAERAALCGAREALAETLATLVASSRPDRGVAFLVGAARLLALEASCARGEWVVLDAFVDGRWPEVPAPRAEALASLVRDADAALGVARQRAADRWDSRRLSAVEDLANLARELRRAGRVGRLRVPEERLVPLRAAVRVDLSPPPISRDALRGLREQAAERERDAERSLARLHAYRLVSRNCVSEIFATLEAELGTTAGWSPARVVPFLSTEEVRRRFRVALEREIPSLHAARRAELLAEHGGALAWLRELSPRSARSFAPAATDSTFVLFADPHVALRPLAGVANLAAGLGAAGVGVARAPWDRGAQLGAGLRGALWSLPELAFVPIRKGSNEYVPPEWIAWVEAQDSTASQRKNTNVTTANSGISTAAE